MVPDVMPHFSMPQLFQKPIVIYDFGSAIYDLLSAWKMSFIEVVRNSKIVFQKFLNFFKSPCLAFFFTQFQFQKSDR